MHIGGGLAKEVVCGEEPSAFGHGVSPVIDAPLTVLGGACVVDEPVVATFFDEPPPLNTPVTPAMRAMIARITTLTTIVRRRDCRRRAEIGRASCRERG